MRWLLRLSKVPSTTLPVDLKSVSTTNCFVWTAFEWPSTAGAVSGLSILPTHLSLERIEVKFLLFLVLSNVKSICSIPERNKELYLRSLQQIFQQYVKLRPSWFDKSFVSSWNVTQLVGMPFSMSRVNKYLGIICRQALKSQLNISLRIQTRILPAIN